MRYEVHVTISREDRNIGQALANSEGWKTSEIARDIVLGEKTYFYLTKHFHLKKGAYDNTLLMVGTLKLAGAGVIRAKIELILFDTKLGDVL